MQIQCGILIAGTLSIMNSAQGNIIFSQDFSSHPSGPESLFVSSTPTSGQWNSISASGTSMTVDIVNGALSYTRSGAGVGTFSRTTDFSPAPEAVIFKFRLELSSATVKANSAAVWQVGSGFSTADGIESTAKVHSQFALNITDSMGGYRFRDLKTGTDSAGGTYSGAFSITWVINNSPTTLQYVAPNGSTRTVGSDRWDLWCGPYSMFLGSQATSAGQTMTDIKFAFTAGSGTLKMDNFSIDDLQAVPEPAATGTMAAGLLLAGVLLKEWRCRQRGSPRP